MCVAQCNNNVTASQTSPKPFRNPRDRVQLYPVPGIPSSVPAIRDIPERCQKCPTGLSNPVPPSVNAVPSVPICPGASPGQPKNCPVGYFWQPGQSWDNLPGQSTRCILSRQLSQDCPGGLSQVSHGTAGIPCWDSIGTLGILPGSAGNISFYLSGCGS